MKKYLLLVMLFTFAVLFTSCASEEVWEYEVDSDGNAQITRYNDRAFSGRETVEVPSVIDSHSVTSIKTAAFFGSKIGDVIISEGITVLDECIFLGANIYGSVSIPASVENISDLAFKTNMPDESLVLFGNPSSYINILEFKVDEANATYTSVDGVLYTKDMKTLMRYPELKESELFAISDGVERILAYAFENADCVERIYVPDSVVEIFSGAFCGMDSLTEVEIGAGVLTIEEDEFWGSSIFHECDLLNCVTVDKENANFVSLDGVLYSKDLKTLIYYPPARATKMFSVPEGVVTVKKYAFHETEYLSSVTLPSSLEKINSRTFSYCEALTEINICSGIKSIEPNAFDKCSSVERMIIPDSVERVERFAFSDCESLAYIRIGSGVNYIAPEFSLLDTRISEIEVDEANKYYKSFDGNLYSKDGKVFIAYAIGKREESFCVPETVEEIGECSFRYSENLKQITVPASVIKIGKEAFNFSEVECLIFQDPNGWVSYYSSGEVEPISAADMSDEKVCARMMRNRYNKKTLEKTFSP